VLFVPVPILAGEKLLDMVGTVGRAQPVIIMLSRYTDEVAFELFRVDALSVNRVVLVPVVVAVTCADVYQVCLFATETVVTRTGDVLLSPE